MSDYLDTENGEGATFEAPVLAIALLTYQRTRLAVRTIESVIRNLDYPNRVWYIADDGSPVEHVNTLLSTLANEKVYAYHNKAFAERPYCGRGWNRALEKCHNATDYILWLEDDWELGVRLDVRPYIRLLAERQEVGMVSMRGLSIGLRMEVEGHRGIHYLRVLREGTRSSMAYSGNPLIRHRRYTEMYGGFSNVDSPGDIEIRCDNQYRSRPEGPSIWRPADMSGWGIWGHIGEERTW